MRRILLIFYHLFVLSSFSLLYAQEAPPVKLLVLGPLQDCEAVKDFKGLGACDEANEKALVDGRIEDGAPGGLKAMPGWLAHPDPSVAGWFIDPLRLGHYAFDMGQMEDIGLLESVMAMISPELRDLRASIFIKGTEVQTDRLLRSQIVEPGPALRDNMIRRLEESLTVPHPPDGSAQAAAWFCLLVGDDARAESFATRAGDLTPTDPDVLALRAAALAWRGRLDFAEADAEAALLLRGDHVLASGVLRFISAARVDPAAPAPSLQALMGIPGPQVRRTLVNRSVKKVEKVEKVEKVVMPKEPPPEPVAQDTVVAPLEDAPPELPRPEPVLESAKPSVVSGTWQPVVRWAAVVSSLVGLILLGVYGLRRWRTAKRGVVPGIQEISRPEKRKKGPPRPSTLVSRGGLLLGDRFRLGEERGMTEMGAVYEGVDLRRESWVTIKKLDRELANTSQLRKDIIREARAAMLVHDLNIATVRGVFAENDDIYIVYEHLGGVTLNKLLEEKGPLDMGQSLPILQCIAMALGAAHASKILHRDLGPTHVLVSGAAQVKVMNFGIADRLVKGRPTPYRSPEQEAGKPAVKTSDIFSFGVLAYEVLCGRSPYPETGAASEKAQGRFIAPGASGKPAGLDPVFLRGLHPDPKKRYPTAIEFYMALESVLHSRVAAR